MTIYSGFSHKKWWFSIVMLVYQRVTSFSEHYPNCFFLCSAAPKRPTPSPHSRQLGGQELLKVVQDLFRNGISTGCASACLHKQGINKAKKQAWIYNMIFPSGEICNLIYTKSHKSAKSLIWLRTKIVDFLVMWWIHQWEKIETHLPVDG